MPDEDAFVRALRQVRDHSLSSLPEEIPAHRFSPEFVGSMREMMARQRRIRRRADFSRLARQAAVFILTGAVGISACVMGVNAWSQQFLVMTEQKYPEYSSITFERSGDAPSQTADLRYAPAWLPEGFFRVQHGESDFFNYVEFEDAQGRRISFQQNPAEHTSINLNTEGTSLEDIPLNDGTAKFLTNRGMQMVLWYDDTYCFMISSDLPRDETIKIAENVRLKSGPYPTLQRLPIESLPAGYDEEQARKNGDVVFGCGEPVNLEKLAGFVEDCDSGKDCAIRIADFKDSHSPVIIDIQKQDGRLYSTRDESRFEESEQPFQLGEEYDNIGILDANGEHILMLYTSHRDKPVEVVRY